MTRTQLEEKTRDDYWPMRERESPTIYLRWYVENLLGAEIDYAKTLDREHDQQVTLQMLRRVPHGP